LWCRTCHYELLNVKLVPPTTLLKHGTNTGYVDAVYVTPTVYSGHELAHPSNGDGAGPLGVVDVEEEAGFL
jgi:hypothetical protein